MDVQQANRASERFPLAGKWQRRLMIVWFFLFAAWVGLGSVTVAQFVLAIAVAVLGAAWALAELGRVVARRGEYIELLPNEIVLTGGFLWWNVRAAYESIASADLRDRWLDRIARSVLKMIGKPNPPGVELRFRRRVFCWSTIWPLKRLYFRPGDPETVVTALSARLGVT